jgi:hypothetical protein
MDLLVDRGRCLWADCREGVLRASDAMQDAIR